MSATLIKGKPIADRIRAQVAEDVAAIGHIGLVTVLVGDDPASEVYIRLKHKAAVEAGIDATDLRLPAETGITATPTSDSAAPANGDRSTDVVRPPSTPIAARRCAIDCASFFLGQRMRRIDSHRCPRR